MDLKSYIKLKEQYVQMHMPTPSEEVEVVEEGSIDEALGTLGDALGNREDARRVGRAEVKPAKPGNASGAGALGTTGDALGGRMVPKASQTKSTPDSKAATATPNVKPRTPTRGRVSPSKQNMAGKSQKPKPTPQSRAANLPTNLKATEKIETQKANDFRAASNKAKPPVSKPATDKPPVSKPPVSKPPVSKPPVSKPPATATGGDWSKSKPTPKPAPKAKQTGDKAKDMATWAKANPTLANKKKTANPLMKGFSKPAPKPSTPTPAAKPNPAAATGSSRLAKALSGIKPMKKLGEEYTQFDLILEYLMDSGFPQEEALVVMVNMSGDKQLEILESYLTEEDADRLRDMRQERGGVDGNTNYKRAPRKAEGSKKSPEERKKASQSAYDFVMADLKKKYGDKAIIGNKKKD